jgi:hypothetical protein
MMGAWSRRWLASVGLALVAALGFVVVAETYDHTDDGCVVETHCLACQWHYGATVVPTIVAKPAAPADVGHAFVHVVATPRLDGARVETPSRAPPLA